ncbi:MAG: IPExxxVDY family protein [Bacteroidales bacterium]|nr:IPExxxVDY family protein [Bacteroidales bacterium]
MKKNKLTIEPFDDIQIIGINSALADYKLAYYFNAELHFDFTRLKEILLDDEHPYAFFYYNAGENRNVYNLVSLKYQGSPCVKLKPQMDYLLIVRNHITDDRLEQLIKKIRSIRQVTYAYVMDLEKLPALDVLLERIEMHM